MPLYMRAKLEVMDKLATNLKTGSYKISVTDNFGNEIHQQITVKE